jgi:hypothetical protein
MVSTYHSSWQGYRQSLKCLTYDLHQFSWISKKISLLKIKCLIKMQLTSIWWKDFWVCKVCMIQYKVSHFYKMRRDIHQNCLSNCQIFVNDKLIYTYTKTFDLNHSSPMYEYWRKNCHRIKAFCLTNSQASMECTCNLSNNPGAYWLTWKKIKCKNLLQECLNRPLYDKLIFFSK